MFDYSEFEDDWDGTDTVSELLDGIGAAMEMPIGAATSRLKEIKHELYRDHPCP